MKPDRTPATKAPLPSVRRPHLPAALAVFAALAAAPASADGLSPIDDFETGAFSLQTMSGVPFVQDSVVIPGHWAHAIASRRTLTLQSSAQGPHTFASASPGTFLDDVMYLNVGKFGSGQLRYNLAAATDLSRGGTVDVIEMDVSTNWAGLISASVTDGVAQSGFSQNLSSPGRQTVLFPLSQWTAGIATQATALWFHFPPNQNGTNYTIYGIRMRHTIASVTDLEGVVIASQTPPVPAPPLEFKPVNPANASFEYRTEVGVADAVTSSLTVPATQWTWAKAATANGEMAEMSLRWTEPGGVLTTSFDLNFDLSEVDGGLTPELYPPDPIHGPESILLSFPVALRDGANEVQKLSNVRVGLDVAAAQGASLHFQNVSVIQSPSPRSWTSGFTLSFTLALTGQGSPDTASPLFTATWISDLTSQAPTDVRPPGPAESIGDRLQLAAVPSVTRSVTDIRANRSVAHATTVLIHDVAGRRVRELALPAGARSATWDGRSAGGTHAAPGVYFVRLAGAANDPTRVVLVR